MSSGYSNKTKNLGAAFEWGIAEVVYHLELQREELKRIVEILEAPLETQAKELRRRAEFAHRNDWIDEALADFLEAEKKNYADFTILQSLGNIYLRKNHLTKAQEYYEKAAKYARPHSSYYTAYALWHLGRVRCLQGKISAAYEATKEATRVQPGLVQALYEHARHCALLMKEEESMSNLKEATEIDRNYSLKALTDESFVKVTQALGVLLETLRQEAKRQAQKALGHCNECLRLVADMEFKWYPSKEYPLELEGKVRGREAEIKEGYQRELEERVQNIEALIKKDSYFDFLDAEELAKNTRDFFVDQAKRWLKNQVDGVSQQIKAKEEQISDAAASLRRGPDFKPWPTWRWSSWGCLTLIITGLFLYILGCGLVMWGSDEAAATLIMVGGGGFLSTVFILLLAYTLVRRRHGSKYQRIIESNSRELLTLQTDLFQLNSLYARANVFYDIYGVRAREKKL